MKMRRCCGGGRPKDERVVAAQCQCGQLCVHGRDMCVSCASSGSATGHHHPFAAPKQTESMEQWPRHIPRPAEIKFYEQTADFYEFTNFW